MSDDWTGRRVTYPRGSGVVVDDSGPDVQVRWDSGGGPTWVRKVAVLE